MTAVELDGKKQYLSSSSDPTALNFSNVWSVSVWSKPELSSEFRMLLAVEDRRRSNGFRLTTAPIPGSGIGCDLRVELTTTSGQVFKHYGWEKFFQAPEWTHVGLTWDGTNLIAYKNGISGTNSRILVNATGVLSNETKQVFYGSSVDGKVASWSGIIGHAAIWDTVLSPAEWIVVASGHFGIDLTVPSGVYTSTSSLRQYWKPGFNSGNVGQNFSGGVEINNLNFVTMAEITGDAP